MTEGKRGWIRGCGLGCGLLLLVVVLFFVVVWAVIALLSARAVTVREQLDESYSSQATFTPRADGAMAASSLERFVAVRRELLPLCDRFPRFQRSFAAVEEQIEQAEVAEEGEEARALIDLLSAAGGAGKGLFDIGRNVAEYSLARNESLLQHQMGLGEYTWIYVVAYYGWLGHEPEAFVLDEDGQPRIFFDRVRGQVVAAIERHLDAVEARPDDVDRDRLEPWKTELGWLRSDRTRLPFQDGVPAEIAASLEPFRGALEETFCPEASELDIMVTSRRGVKFDHH